MLRVIQEIQPTWVIGENVPGLVNWSKGVVFEEVQSDLEAEGYEVQSFILPAAGVGAPHRRDRVWIVAYKSGAGLEGRRKANGWEEYESEWPNIWDNNSPTCKCRVASNPTSNRRMWNRTGFAPKKGQQQGFIQAWQLEGGFEGLRFQGAITDTPSPRREKRQQSTGQSNNPEDGTGMELWGKRPGNNGDATDASDTRLQGGEKFRSIASEWPESDKQPTGRICSDWQNFPTQSPICNGDDGVSAGLVRYILRNGGDCYTEEEAEKEAKRIISKVRAEGIKAGGNAIVHQVALQIFKSINEFEKSL